MSVVPARLEGEGDMQYMCRWIGDLRRRKGFATPESLVGDLPVLVTKGDLIIIKLMKIVNHLSMAAEAVRKGNQDVYNESIDLAITMMDGLPDPAGGEDISGPHPDPISNMDALHGKAMLFTTEHTEMLEAGVANDKKHVEEEIADAYIRMNDVCDALQIDIYSAIMNKMLVNESRPAKHGKLTNL